MSSVYRCPECGGVLTKNTRDYAVPLNPDGTEARFYKEHYPGEYSESTLYMCNGHGCRFEYHSEDDGSLQDQLPDESELDELPNSDDTVENVDL